MKFSLGNTFSSSPRSQRRNLILVLIAISALLMGSLTLQTLLQKFISKTTEVASLQAVESAAIAPLEQHIQENLPTAHTVITTTEEKQNITLLKQASSLPQEMSLEAPQSTAFIDPSNELKEKITSLYELNLELEEKLEILSLANSLLENELATLKKERDTPQEIPPPAEKIYHLVIPGDSLTSISQTYYGTSKRWKEIYEANRNLLPNQHAIKAGTKLLIPNK